MLSVLTSCGTRRAKWLVAAFWLLVFFGLNAANIFDRFADAEQNRAIDYLPENAESVKVLNEIEERTAGREEDDSAGGETAADPARDVLDQGRVVPDQPVAVGGGG